MIASARRLLRHVIPCVATLALANVSAGSATARPLLDSDLPADVRDAALSGKPTLQGAGAWSQSGEASYYRSSRRFSRTSSGESYDENGMTAAHPYLPLGTRVRVTRQDTGASVVVRINDRQGSHSRVIDLSYGAARRLGMLSTGLVTLTQASPTEAIDEPMEVAEAPAGDEAADFTPRHGRRRTHLGGRAVATAHRSSHVRFAALVQRSAPHRAARHRL